MRRFSYHASPVLALIMLAHAGLAQTPGGIALPPLPQGEAVPAAPAVALPSAPATDAVPSLPPTPVVSNTPAAAAALAGTENVPGLPGAAEATSQPAFSFGTFSASLFYDAASINAMKQVLTTAETQVASKPTVTEKVVTEKAPAPAITDPVAYPVFYLSSILYRSPSDWTVWVGDKKITPHKNTTELQIIGLNANAATFTWTPVFAQTLAQRRAGKLFAPVDAVRNRLVTPQILKFDDATSTATFTLRPNQSFAAGYMAVFEGAIAAPTMPALTTVTPGAVNAAAGAAPGGGGLAQEAIERMAKEAGALPQPTPAAVEDQPLTPRPLIASPFTTNKP